MNWLKENWFKVALLFSFWLFGLVFFRYDFVPEQISNTREFIHRCDRITGECEATTPLTREGILSKYGLD